MALVAIILSLNVGVDVYRVHCDMRDKTYVSFLTAYDPCLDNQEEEQSACCTSNTHCSVENEEHDEDSCCDEEQITITYEPDFFQHTHIHACLSPWLIIAEPSFSFTSISIFAKTASIKQYPQPPPLSGRDILTFHAVLRI